MWSYRKFEKLKSLEIILQNCSVKGKLQVLTVHMKKKNSRRLNASEFSVTVYMFLFIFLYRFCF